MFEGLGVGSRLAYLRLPARYNWVAIAAAVLYAVTTPLGIAIGLGVRTTYNPDSTTASVVSGILDALSSGILLYTGLVEVCYSIFNHAWTGTDLSFEQLTRTASRSRIPFQSGHEQGVNGKTQLCMHLYVIRCWYHGIAWSLGLEDAGACADGPSEEPCPIL